MSTLEILLRPDVKNLAQEQKQSSCDRRELHLDQFSHLLFTVTWGVCNQRRKHTTLISRTDNQNSQAKRVLNPEGV